MAPLASPSFAGAAFVLLSALVAPGSAKSFLRQVDTHEEVEASLMAELAGTFRPSATKDHIIEVEAKLKPMYAAVPQKADGTLSHTVVRYVLHRFFAQRGWFIRGLEPAGNVRNASGTETLKDLQEWVPSFLQNFLEQLAGGRGISARELAVLAATIEDLIHKEALGRLQQAFEALEMPLDAELDDEQVKEVLEVYMMIYQIGDRFDNIGRQGPSAVRKAHKIFTEKVKDWGSIQEWMGSVKRSMYPSGTLDFNAAGLVVEAVGEGYGKYNEKECGALKSTLLDMESKKAGRVRLTDFYKQGLNGVFNLNEKIDYLRDLGAIDESDPAQPHVIVSNYVGSRPNCMKASHFYVICCRNECEDLIGKLEFEFADEDVAPEQILKLVATLSSDTVEAPRKLSSSLAQRLHGIAKGNGGQVPLHGRLFAQWMHHAFPRECPYPHEAGRTNPQTPDEWMQEKGHEGASLTNEELTAHVSNDGSEHVKGAEARKHHAFEENELPWSETEELLQPSKFFKASQAPQATFYRQLPSIVVFLMLGAAAYRFASGLDFPRARHTKSAKGPSLPQFEGKRA